MAYGLNYKFWLATAEQMRDTQLKEAATINLDKLTDRNLAHLTFADLYARYLDLVNKLNYIYSRTFQVQKRQLVETLLLAATERLIELRNELKNIEMNEFIYIDKTLRQKKLVPDDILVLTPPYFPFWRSPEIERIIVGPRISDEIETEEEMKARLKAAKRPQTANEKSKIPLTPEQQIRLNSILMIQSHERCRVSRVLLTNIHYNPDKYKPVPATSIGFYTFTHKPEQLLLYPVKNTRFDANYYINKASFGSFEYYAKPVKKVKIIEIVEDDTFNDDEMSIITLTDFKKPQIKSDKQIAQRTTNFIEDYYIMGMLNVVEYDNVSLDDGKKLLRASSNEFIRKRIHFRLECAVKKIQKLWRDYCQRKLLKKRQLEEKFLIGFASKRLIKKCLIKDMFAQSHARRLKVEQYYINFQKTIEDERNRIVQIKSPWIMEDISDHIRAWFREFYNVVGDFHPFPPVDKGGTILLLLFETMTPKQFAEEKIKKKPTKAELKKIKDKIRTEKKREKEKIKKIKRAEANAKATNLGRGLVYYNMNLLENNPLIQTMAEKMKEYDNEWYYVDEKNNISEDPFIEWIKSDLYAVAHRELRATVDELMRIEFELLRMALSKDLKKKYKKQKDKKPKKQKKKKAKKVIDLTAGRTIHSLYYEMQDAGLIKAYNNRCMTEFIGDINYLAFEIRNYFQLESEPSMGEVRDIFREWMLGMGPLNIKKPKSILVAGPCAKHKLCDILASETNAVVIDLSPENVIKYDNNLPYLINLVNKMARLFQPTIILINDVHRVFWKKIPPEFKDLKPQLLGPILNKQIIKPIKSEEKIFVLGTTTEPWTAKGKLAATFEKILLVPKVDYSSSFILWRTLCLQKLGIPRDYEFSPIALVTRNYTSGNIVNNINKTVNIERRMLLSRKKLEPMEFIETFLTAEPPLFEPEEKIVSAYQKWFLKSNKLAKQRQKFIKKFRTPIVTKKK